MDVLERIRQRASAARKHVVLPEGEDDRTIVAARMCREQGVARVTLVGAETKIRERAAALGADLGDTPVVEPKESPRLEEYARILYERRRAKGVTMDEARRTAHRWRIRQPPDYDTRNRSIIRTQLARGGYRLAAVLRAIWP